ncbi:hypothetical protein [Campylobacter pinnipediorum]|uniref:hypothetical protein n=1 Tax=Campylobacter pinnipediorum TaxID=1965231 RepID=UPI000994CDDB|nr:hypothetical protein [Campylobacter pinnipediorum]
MHEKHSIDKIISLDTANENISIGDKNIYIKTDQKNVARDLIKSSSSGTEGTFINNAMNIIAKLITIYKFTCVKSSKFFIVIL